MKLGNEDHLGTPPSSQKKFQGATEDSVLKSLLNYLSRIQFIYLEQKQYITLVFQKKWWEQLKRLF